MIRILQKSLISNLWVLQKKAISTELIWLRQIDQGIGSFCGTFYLTTASTSAVSLNDFQRHSLSKPYQVMESFPQRRISTSDFWYLRFGANNPIISDDLKSVILSLIKKSQSPLATCLKKTWNKIPHKIVEQWEEVPGWNFRGKIEGILWELTSELSSESHPRRTCIATLKKEERNLVSLEFLYLPYKIKN